MGDKSLQDIVKSLDAEKNRRNAAQGMPLVNGVLVNDPLEFLLKYSGQEWWLGYDDWGDHRWVMLKKDAARMSKRRAEELQLYYSRLGDQCELIRIQKDDTPEWARKDPNICPCGIHRAQCDYHK